FNFVFSPAQLYGKAKNRSGKCPKNFLSFVVSMNCNNPSQTLTRKEIVMGRPVVYWELMSKDPGKVSDFYQKVFDWKIQHLPEMNYRCVETGGEGGINLGGTVV